MSNMKENVSVAISASDLNNNEVTHGKEIVAQTAIGNIVQTTTDTTVNATQGNLMAMPVTLPFSGLNSVPLTFCAVNGVGNLGTNGVIQPGVQPSGIILLNMGGTNNNNIQSTAQIVMDDDIWEELTCGNQIDQNQSGTTPTIINQLITSQPNVSHPQMVMQQQPQLVVQQPQRTIQQPTIQQVQQMNASLPAQSGVPSGYMLVPIHQVPVNQPVQQMQTLQQSLNVIQQPLNATINQVANTNLPAHIVQQPSQTIVHQQPIQVIQEQSTQPASQETPFISTANEKSIYTTTAPHAMPSIQQTHSSLYPNKGIQTHSNLISLNVHRPHIISSLAKEQPEVLQQLIRSSLPEPHNTSADPSTSLSNPGLSLQQFSAPSHTNPSQQTTPPASAKTSSMHTKSPINDPHISSSELPPTTPNLEGLSGINPLLLSAMMKKLSQPTTMTTASPLMEMFRSAMTATIEGEIKSQDQQTVSDCVTAYENLPIFTVGESPTKSQASTSTPVNTTKPSTPSNLILQAVLPNPNEEKDKPVKRKRGPAPKLDGHELCLICSDKASGYHYGVLSCEGCKGFFRRSVIQKKIYRCKNEGKCQMDSFMRRKCQKCRLEKCRLTGMKDEGVLSEDGVPKKKVKKENKEKGSTFVASPLLFAPNLSFTGEPVPSLSSQQRNLVEMLQANETRFQWPSEEDVARVTAWVENGDSHRSRASRFAHFTELAILIVQLVVEFTKQLPGFLTVTREDQITLLKACTIEVMLLRAAKQYDMHTGSINFLNGQFYNKSSFYRAGMQVEFVDPIFDFCNSMARLKLDEAEIAMLVAINTFSPDRPNIKDMKKVEAVQDSYVELLRVYLKIHHPSDPLMFPRVLMKLVELRTLNNYHSEQIFALKVQDKQLPPLLAEIWDM